MSRRALTVAVVFGVLSLSCWIAVIEWAVHR